ncbi:hypothetical protein FTE_0716 [Francisella tularensis subsp. novicida FTE]|nr:hypothetical protein FTE_0716 [Francisella tularensis subsp. novicida FTE]
MINNKTIGSFISFSIFSVSAKKLEFWVIFAANSSSFVNKSSRKAITHKPASHQ